MNYKSAIRKFGLPAAPEHRAAILSAFDAEIVKEAAEEGDHDLIKCLSAQLFTIGLVEDSLVIWQAKAANFDLMCGLDIQFLCGAGIEETRAFLGSSDSAPAAEALEYLEECIEAGDFEDWTPEKWVAYYRSYFGLDSKPSSST